jgi:predicted transcriptional regulator
MTRASKSRPDTRADLGRRERQIVEAVYRLGRASVADVRANIDDPPSYSAVRGMLNLLEEKGHLRHEVDGLRYIYVPVVAASQARRSAMAHVVRTFFAGSAADAASALLELPGRTWSREDLERLSALVHSALHEEKRS